MKFKTLSLLVMSAFCANAQFNWFGCFQKCIPTFKCNPAPVPSGTYAVNPMGVVSCIAATNYYNTISSAIAAAPSGAVIHVCPGTYAEQVTITKPVTVVGIVTGSAPNYNYPTVVPEVGFGPTLVGGKPVLPTSPSLQDGLPVAAQIAVIGTTASVENLLLIGTNNGLTTSSLTAHLFGIYYQNASGTISGNMVTEELTPTTAGEETGYGIFVESGKPGGVGTAGSTTVSITNNGVLDFQTIGIGAVGASTTATVTGNSLALSTGTFAAQSPNGIEFESAGGSISNNTIAKISSTSGFASVGIFLVASGGISVTSNTVTAVDAPILTFSDSKVPTSSNPDGASDNTTITGNSVTGTNFKLADGIDVCSNYNTINSNTTTNTQNAGIHLDTGCPGTKGTKDATSGNNNSVQFNNISYTCEGIAEGGDYNSAFFNNVSNSTNVIFQGDYCGVSESTVGNVNLLDGLNNPLGLSLFQLLQDLLKPILAVCFH